MSAIVFRPLSQHCGVVAENVDLTNIDEGQLSSLKNAVAKHGVLFMKNQSMGPEQHIDLAERWGGIDVNNYFPANGGYPEIAEVRKSADQTTNIGGGWHTDHSYDPVPAMGSILIARETPPSGGDTLFANMGAAYDSLSDGLKTMLQGLRAVHSADHIYGPDGIYAKTDLAGDLKGQELHATSTHPVVIRHPETGRKILYVNPAFTLYFEGWTRAESLPLLQYLCSVGLREEFRCRLEWAPGSVAVWDNRMTWHCALNDYQGHSRLMHRITVSGVPLHG